MLRDDIVSRTFDAAADASGIVGYAVQQDGAATIQAWDTAAEPPLGLLASVDPRDNTKCRVALPGSIMYAVAGETLAPGTDFFLTTDGAGKLIAAAAGEYFVAVLADRQGADDGLSKKMYPGQNGHASSGTRSSRDGNTGLV